MPDSNFIAAFNKTNDQLFKDCAEQFQLVHKGGEIEDLMAISIDDISSAVKSIPGGKMGDNSVNVHVWDNDIGTNQIQVGNILIVYGKRVRVLSIESGGDNANILVCGPVGVIAGRSRIVRE
jgi:hypothetical protein